uniref:Uncharacterized protein n=1 Tax=Schistocephalus solidus TaxID=70667 RepID=A0A0X3PM70_SCHSO
MLVFHLRDPPLGVVFFHFGRNPISLLQLLTINIFGHSLFVWRAVCTQLTENECLSLRHSYSCLLFVSNTAPNFIKKSFSMDALIYLKHRFHRYSRCFRSDNCLSECQK